MPRVGKTGKATPSRSASSASSSPSSSASSGSTSGSSPSSGASSGSTGSTSGSTGSGSTGSTSSGRPSGRSYSSSPSQQAPKRSYLFPQRFEELTTPAPTITQKPVSTLSTKTATIPTSSEISKPVISGELSRAIIESQANFPDAWAKATGTTNKDKQYEQVTATSPIQPITAQLQEIEEIAQEEERIKQIEQAPIYQRLDDQIQNIINDINAGAVQVPDWFRNNIEWVQTGHISQHEFLTAYNYLVDQQIVHAPEMPTVEPVIETISTDMINQRLDYFTIQNGRAKGQITFTLNDNFNPFYYNKDILNIVQFKTKNGVSILLKENRLRFTATERTETIQYDEDMLGNLTVDLESFVWLGTAQPTPFSPVLRMEIREGETASPTKTGIMGAGVAGAMGILILLGFIIDGAGKKKK